MNKKTNICVKVSYFMVSLIVIILAYLYTDDLMVWVFKMMMDAVSVSLEQVLR